jgi:CubicO group peptidase (beta-lactamase class C family)
MRPRRRLVLRIVTGLVVVLLVALVGGYVYAKPLLLTATGYAAHNACAVPGVAGRTDPATDLPPNPLVPYLRTSSHPEASRVDATVLGVLAGQTAWYRADFGCVLAGQEPSWGSATRVSPGPNPFTAAPSPTPSADVQAAVAMSFGDDLSSTDKTALGTRAVVVVRHGQLVAERYAPGFSPTTPQLGWSMSKSVANLLAGRLVAQGKLAITDDHLRPEWTDDRARITVDELSRMTSGLAWDETYDLGTPITRMLYLEPDMAAYVAAQPLAHPPGSYQQYSSGSTNLLCSVLTSRGGGGADLPRRQIFAPLGLSSAVWEPDAAGTPVCSSYLWATPRDWAAIWQFALQRGAWAGQQLLPVDWVARSTTALAGQSEEVGYAAGWWVNQLADGTLANPALPADTYYADGHDGQRVYVVPSADLVVVRLGFSPGVTDDKLRVATLVHDLVALPAG